MTPLTEQGSLHRRVEGPALARVLSAALAAVEPAAAIRREVEAFGAEGDAHEGPRKIASGDWLRIGKDVLPLTAEGGVWCIAVGKAAPVMAAALVRRIPAEKLRGGVIVAKHAPALRAVDASELARNDVDGLPLPLVIGAHPIPDERSVAAGRAVLDVLARVRPDDVVVVALSGGASSLMVAPAPGLGLDDLRALGRTLLESGMPIVAMNTVRKALDQLKGGGLLRRATPARVATLVLSDVVDGPLHAVGSGPTMPDRAGRAAARALLEHHAIAVPPAIARHLAQTDDPLPDAAPGPIVELASNATAVDAAITAARAEGWQVRREPPLLGDAASAGRALARALRDLRPRIPTLVVAGGETTVEVRGHGRGGRLQTLALAAMLELDGAPGATLVTLATDGEDGPTDAAGAVVDGRSLARARALGLDPQAHLRNDDAYPVFDALEDLLRIGPTGTNVCDLVLALALP